jgi:hypothetical protein
MTTKKRRKKRPRPPANRTEKKRGRPTVFGEVVREKMLVLAKDGATNPQIAEAIGVSTRTIEYWLHKDPDLFRAIKDQKDLADQLVEASLFQRAIGYQRPAVKHFLDKKQVHDEFTGEAKLQTVVIEHHYVEHHAPSEVAAIFWLKNRQPDRWREKPEPTKPEDSGQTQIVYEAEWGGTGEPTLPHVSSDDEGEAK